jgi:MFS family permease
VLYAVAMATGAVSAPIIGKLFDKFGFAIVVVGLAIASFFAPLAFLGGSTLALLGMILWGLGMGVQDSSLKAILSGIIPAQKRSTAFGVFDTTYGIAWFVGSVAMGLLYRASIRGLVAFSMVLEIAALPVLLFANVQRQTE